MATVYRHPGATGALRDGPGLQEGQLTLPERGPAASGRAGLKQPSVRKPKPLQTQMWAAWNHELRPGQARQSWGPAGASEGSSRAITATLVGTGTVGDGSIVTIRVVAPHLHSPWLTTDWLVHHIS